MNTTCRIGRIFAIACVAGLIAFVLLSAEAEGRASIARAGSPLDVAPFGSVERWDEDHAIGVVWEDPRDVRQIVIYPRDAKSAPPEGLAVQYWRSEWPRRRIPRDRKSGAGSSGWLNIGDWFRGDWQDADASLRTDRNRWVYSFAPINNKEFPDLEDFNADWRTTLKIRVVFPSQPPPIERLEVFTDSVLKETSVKIEWGGEGKQTWDGHVEVFNGHVVSAKALSSDSAVQLTSDASWKSETNDGTDGIALRFLYAESPNVNSFDKTIVTVRTQQGDFSFGAEDVAAGKPIYAPHIGVFICPVSSDETMASHVEKLTALGRKTIYDRVFDEPEQILDRVWNAMPPKRRFYIPLSCEGTRQHFGVDPSGDVFAYAGWLRRIQGKDSDRVKWGADRIRYSFGLTEKELTERSIEDGELPIINTVWSRGGVEYRQSCLVAPLDGSIREDLAADDTNVLFIRFVLSNPGDQPKVAFLLFLVDTAGQKAALALEKDLIYVKESGERRFRMQVDIHGRGRLQDEAGTPIYRVELSPGKQSTVDVKIPFITLEGKEIGRFRRASPDRAYGQVKDYWKRRIDQGCQIVTPEGWINDFYRAHAVHLLINSEREVGSNRRMVKVGTFHYGVFSNESIMMITDLDRRGYHREAEDCLETFLHYQGTVPLPGSYGDHEGVFYGANGYEAGGYNQHHGWVLWGLGEHYRYTRDRKWLARAAPNIVKACDWIIRERQQTLDLPADSPRRIERGLLPPGSLEDIGDWWCWLSTNAYSYWGMENAARALDDIRHPEAPRILEEAEAYRGDILTAFRKAMVRSPLVELRDGTWIPHIPPKVHRRGRAFSWITEALEGAIHLIRCGVLQPFDPESEWIIKDFEDNIYLSEEFGYTVPNIDRDWFDLGGFSMQPNLLCGPIPYLQRDEIKHFLRAYFNAFAVTFYPDTRMLTEHPLPGMGDWRGDHYKASDESQSTYWLRLMFISEEGDNLFLGKAIPRLWMRDGQTASISNAATYFGRMGFEMRSAVSRGTITMVVQPPARNLPDTIYARFRHPEGKKMIGVRVNGRTWEYFDADRELVQLPPLEEKTTIIVKYP